MAAPPARKGWDMRRYRRYFLSITAGGLAFSVRAGFDPLLLDNAPFVFFLPAVLVACFFLGRGPAALTTGLGLVLGDVYFQPPRGTPTVAYDALAEGLAYLIPITDYPQPRNHGTNQEHTAVLSELERWRATRSNFKRASVRLSLPVCTEPRISAARR